MVERLPRMPFPRPVHVLVVGDESRRRLIAGNVSRGGMFLRCASMLPAGAKLSLSLEASGKALPFAEAEVVWSADPQQWSAQGRIPGFGVRFLRFLHPRAPELLDVLLQRTPAKAEEPMQPIEDLNPSSPPAPAPAWSDSLELTPAEPEEKGAKGERWFREPTEEHPPSAFGANDTSTRVGAAVVLLAFLAVIAGGLLWVIRRDATPPAAEAAEPARAEVAQNEPSTQAEPKPLQAEPVEASPAPVAAEAQAAAVAAAPATAEPTPNLQAAPKPIQAQPAEARPAPVVTAHPKPEPKPAAAKATAHQVALSAGAVKAVSFSRSGKDIRAALAFAPGSKVDRVFVLKSPNRVVVDVTGSTPHGSAQLKAGIPGVETVRVGALRNGTRLVFDVPGLAGAATLKGSSISFDVR